VNSRFLPLDMSGEMLTHALPHDAGLAVVHGKSFFDENGGCVSFSACSAVPLTRQNLRYSEFPG
jgi:hypothetical protein